MNYRHGFHAGNFADVLKHLALCELLQLLTAKDKKLFVLDTHAGAGGYDLGGALARRTGEADGGVARLMAASRTGMPGTVARYLAAVSAYDRKFGAAGGPIRHYPGSPRFVRSSLRAGDRFVACELHAQEALALKREFAGDRAVEVRDQDGYHALKALLPPAERRGLVLIDPPFEDAGDFPRLAQALEGAHRKWAGGTYLLWYPVTERTAPDALARRLARGGMAKILRAELRVAVPRSRVQPRSALEESCGDRLGACAIIVVNPPWTLADELAVLLPALAATLSPGGAGSHRVDWLAGEK